MTNEVQNPLWTTIMNRYVFFFLHFAVLTMVDVIVICIKWV